MTISYWLDDRQDKPLEHYDLAIIGGGIIGAATAYWLGKRGGLRVCVLEANTPAYGASGRNSGFVLRGIFAYYNQAVKLYGRDAARWIFQFNEQTQGHLRDFVAEYGNTFSYDPCGSYLLACSLEELQNLEESAQLMQEDGFEVEYLKYDPIKRDFYGAIFNRGDLAVNPAELVQALLTASGGTVLSGSQVFKLERTDGRLIAHTTDRLVHAEKMILATNAYACLMDSWFVPRLQPVRGQIIVTRPLKKRILDAIYYANYGYEYFRQLPDNRLLLGGCREPFRQEEIGFADMVTQPVQSALMHYLKDRFPEAVGTPIDYKWAGIMAFTADGLPMLGEHPQMDGLYFAVGCNGHGMGYSMALSKLLVELALDGREPGLFAYDRAELEDADAVKRGKGDRAEESVGP